MPTLLSISDFAKTSGLTEGSVRWLLWRSRPRQRSVFDPETRSRRVLDLPANGLARAFRRVGTRRWFVDPVVFRQLVDEASDRELGGVA